MKNGTCIHYTGYFNEPSCKAGVNYKETFDSKTPGIVHRMPCYSVGQESASCDKREEPTAEQIAQSDRDDCEYMAKVSAALKVSSEWRLMTKPDADREEVIECPLCKGSLHLIQFSYNGHVHGKCETSGCISWME